MKKIAVILLVTVLAAAAALTSVSCNGNTNVSGAVWANEETIQYDIMRGTDNIGTLTVKLEKLSPNSEVTLNATGENFKINSSAHGTRITTTAVSADGVEWLKSESIMDMFTSIASYRKVNYNGEAYELKGRYEDKYFYFSLNGGEEERLRVGESGFADREQLYTVVRAYDLDAGYAGSYKIADPLSNEVVEVAVSTAGETTFNFDYTATDFEGNSKPYNTTSAVMVTFSRSSAPQGKAIQVIYSASDAIEVLGNPAGSGFAAGGNSSVRIPLRIVENDISYNIKNISCK